MANLVLRDAALCAAPQDEGRQLTLPHPEERPLIFWARLEGLVTKRDDKGPLKI